MTQKFDLIILGGGAAGFFAAIHAAERQPNMRIAILEKSGETLNKVRISGGGRCNVTHHCPDPNKLIHYYPRGHEFLLPSFEQFGVKETRNWFEKQGVPLKTEPDGRVFPKSDSSESIIRALRRQADRFSVTVIMRCGHSKLERIGSGYSIKNDQGVFESAQLILATGGHPKAEQYAPYESLGLKIVPPRPSLFTFKLKPHPYKDLMGLSVDIGSVQIEKAGVKQTGAILITHWGLSGPAVITSSAWQARLLSDLNYQFKVNINWVNETAKEAESTLLKFAEEHPKKSLYSRPPLAVPARLWKAMLERLEIPEFRNWAECGKKTRQKIIQMLTQDALEVQGKSTFKEEFVTAGGVDLDQLTTDFEAKELQGLFVIGELANIDAVTGGFNFQAAWTGGYLAGIKAAENHGR